MKKVNKPNMDISFSLMKKEENSSIQGVSANSVTDSLGNFSFHIEEDIYGDWKLILRATENGKEKINRVMLNSLYEPTPRTYNPYETLLLKKDKNKKKVNKKEAKIAEEEADNNWEKEFEKYYDPSLSMTERFRQLDEFVITAEKSIFTEEDVTESSFVYDAEKAIDKILDKGGEVTTSIEDFLVQLDPNFVHNPQAELKGQILTYKNMRTFLMINNMEKLEYFEFAKRKYETVLTEVPTNDITRVVLSYGGTTIVNFDEKGNYGRSSEKRQLPKWPSESNSSAYNRPHSDAVKNFRPVSQYVYVFIYTKDQINDPQRATRETTFKGYSAAQEFYSPNHSEMPDERDHRRTLYWNPNVKTDKDGKASVMFYNNSSAKTFDIDAQTVTANNEFGILEE